MASESEFYPNSPLENVACEIRFPGDLNVECNRHLFWNDIRGDYPHVMVPKAVQDAAPALQHYRFCSDDSQRRVSVALNSLAYSDSNYQGHKGFLKEFCRLADMFRKRYPEIDSVSRIGWRYINHIPFARVAGEVPVKQLLRADLLLPKSALESPRTVDIRVESKQDEGITTLRLATISRDVAGGTKQEALLLDMDCYFEQPELRFKSYRTYLKSAHAHNRQLFDDLITDGYRSYLLGDTL